ncbi:hypothetical protein Sjap_002069 [Stephania japonica]|uniref:Uncharacterized protein n=1 Tax=Stephania japonica TaxID=461633 RepID=A0AAP0KNH2_9MAGN
MFGWYCYELLNGFECVGCGFGIVAISGLISKGFLQFLVKNVEFEFRTCVVNGFWFHGLYGVFNELLEQARITVRKFGKTLSVKDAVRHAVGFRTHDATRDVLDKGQMTESRWTREVLVNSKVGLGFSTWLVPKWASLGTGKARLGKAGQRLGKAWQRVGKAWQDLARLGKGLAKSWQGLARSWQGAGKTWQGAGKVWQGTNVSGHGVARTGQVMPWHAPGHALARASTRPWHEQDHALAQTSHASHALVMPWHEQGKARPWHEQDHALAQTSHTLSQTRSCLGTAKARPWHNNLTFLDLGIDSGQSMLGLILGCFLSEPRKRLNIYYKGRGLSWGGMGNKDKQGPRARLGHHAKAKTHGPWSATPSRLDSTPSPA